MANKLKLILQNCSHYSNVPLTCETYKKIVRGPYKNVSDNDLRHFESILDKTRVVTNDEDLLPYNTDWMNAYRGQSKVVLKPKSVDEVGGILKYCNDQKLAVVPQGGNTGLVGGSIPVFDEVIVSMGLMNQIKSIDELSGSVICEAGVILENLNNEINKFNLCVPVDLGAKGSCQIGGNVSTNAGGIRLLRYGSLHGNVLGLKAVLPNGDVMDCLTALRKDNTGYDLKHLFIGAEGSLGIITDVSLLCPTKPSSVNAAFLGLHSFEQVLSTFKIAKSKLGEILSAFELMDKESIASVENQLGYKSPLDEKYEFSVLVETSGSQNDHDQDKLDSFLAEVLELGHVADGTVAQDQSQIQKFWDVRENIIVAYEKVSGWYFDDVSMTLEYMPSFMEMKSNLPADWLKDGLSLSLFGHMGDGNLHLNVVAPRYNPDLDKRLEKFVYGWLQKHRGSISAEHGLGLKKSSYLHYSKTPLAIDYMYKIKKLFDPNEIMNPYKYLPKQ